MCLVVVALGATSHLPLLLAANRDERHARSTERAGWWPELPRVFGGRDLEAGGTWLGVDRRGLIAAVTTVRDGVPRAVTRARGALPTGVLAAEGPAASSAARAAAAGSGYAAFNLLLFDGSEFRYASNRAATAALAPGVHAFSNATYGVEWPKTASAKAGVERLLAEADPTEPLFALLAQRGTGTTPEERYLSAPFVAGPVYGTRCSTVILLDADGTLTFAERSFVAAGEVTGESRATFAVERS